MSNEIQQRNSDTYNMTPFNFLKTLVNGIYSMIFKPKFNQNRYSWKTDNEYFVEAELPGIPKEDIQVTYENGVLTISGQHQIDTTCFEDKKKEGWFVANVV